MTTKTEPMQAEKCRVIAERVMGHSLVQDSDGAWAIWDTDGLPARIPDYFHDPAAMVAVMGKMGVDFIAVSGTDDPEYKYGCKFWQDNNRRMVYGPTPMHAVAEAAYAWAMGQG